MAPDPKPPGRKPGRPPNASKPPPSASQDRPDEYEADIEEAAAAARPRQRGRPKKNKDADATDPAPAQDDEQQPQRKRGRPSPESRDVNATTTAAEDAPQPKRKHGRPSLEKQQKDTETTENTAPTKRSKAAKDGQQQDVEQDEEPQPRKRGRKPAAQQQQQQQQVEEPEPEEQEPAPRKKRRREAPSAPEPEQEEQPPRRSPRNSLRDLGPDSTHNKGRKVTGSKKKGQTSDAPAEDAENQDTEAAPAKKRGRKPAQRPSTEQMDEPQQQQQQDTTKKKGRRRTSKDAAASSGSDDDALPSPPKPYLHVAPYTRTIRSSTIAAKWTPLEGATLSAASSILALAHQPILQRTSSTRNRRAHASAALHLVSRRIERKLARGLPFPPASAQAGSGGGGGGGRLGRRRGADVDGGRALELDFESVLDGRAALERQLVPGMHAVELLRAERDRMERELERDYEDLSKLEESARAQTRKRKDLYRKAHVLAPTTKPLPVDPQDQDMCITAADDGGAKDSLRQELVDTPLEPLALQLAGHVESIRGNLQQADGVTPQLGRTRAALQDVLQRYLDRESYEQVLLG
ncbi:hypothetical protein ACJ41O_011488 [Fusarium nematophilum]